MSTTAESTMTAAAATNHHPPRVTLPSPWVEVVRGEPESPAEQTSFRDCSVKSPPSTPPEENPTAEISDGVDEGNAGRSRAVWSKPSNGAAVAAVEVERGAVMGAEAWPALSEAARVSMKSTADPASKSGGDDGSSSTTQVSVVQHTVPVSHNKLAVSTPTVTGSTTNHDLPVQQRPVKRGGGGGGGNGSGSRHNGGGHSHRGFTHPPPPPPPPPFPFFQLPPNSYGTMVPPLSNTSPREPPYRATTWESRPIVGFVPQPHMVNDQRSNSRRGNYGSRGDGSYRNNFGSRRDHMQPQRGSPRGIIRPSSPAPFNTVPFITTQNVRPFPAPMGFADPTSPIGYYSQLPSYRGVPYISPPGPPPPFLMPPPEKPLPARILDQIEFYFSDANLIKDDFLKSKMDDQGWVPVALIAGFPRVKGLTDNVHLILDSLRTSTLIEVQDDKLRRRNEWAKWMPNSGSSSSGAETAFQKLGLEETKHKHGDIHPDAVAGTSAGSARQEPLSNGGDSLTAKV